MTDSGRPGGNWARRSRVLIVAVIAALVVAVGVTVFNTAPEMGAALIGSEIADPRSAGRAESASTSMTRSESLRAPAAEFSNAGAAAQAVPSEIERVRTALRRVLADEPDTLAALESLLDEPDPLVLAENLAMLRSVFIEPAGVMTTGDNE